MENNSMSWHICRLSEQLKQDPFSVWCPLKGHSYLNKRALSVKGLFKLVWPFSEHKALKG